MMFNLKQKCGNIWLQYNPIPNIENCCRVLDEQKTFDNFSRPKAFGDDQTFIPRKAKPFYYFITDKTSKLP